MASVDYGLGEEFQPKHVDRRSLYVNLEEPDVQALRDGAKYLKQLIPTVTTLVYKKLLQWDITSRAFHTHTTANEDELEEDFLTEDTPQIRRRKMFLRWYLTRLCQDPAGMDFWKYLARVGRMHSGQERLHPLNVEYIHLSACLGYICDMFIEAVFSHPQLSLRKKIALMRALNKVIWIQNDLFAKWRCRDGEEFDDEMSISSFGSKDIYAGLETLVNSPIEDDRASIASSVAPSMRSAAPSTHTAQPPHTTHTKHTTYTAPPQNLVCPFASMTTGSSTETKIWAD
ncbi:hypothetical protein N7468_001090 [Penicillium chermesinum]|uniref:Globin-sensor domain-containing protein n=1 Tax=Penicillium chermesinum TaxID=63820 RepID=A0A9W9PH57_9EURO|nr:uncharacterized protein N7468_001090 [Penicillium chermesinum]KAJ5246107.1 hypothetical protein N7468_001090 [Penicillium chermesinum]